jgi:hypothetical protein
MRTREIQPLTTEATRDRLDINPLRLPLAVQLKQQLNVAFIRIGQVNDKTDCAGRAPACRPDPTPMTGHAQAGPQISSAA